MIPRLSSQFLLGWRCEGRSPVFLPSNGGLWWAVPRPASPPGQAVSDATFGWSLRGGGGGGCLLEVLPGAFACSEHLAHSIFVSERQPGWSSGCFYDPASEFPNPFTELTPLHRGGPVTAEARRQQVVWDGSSCSGHLLKGHRHSGVLI